MPQYSAIIRSLSTDKFVEILGASPRQAREIYFARHSIRAPKTRGLPRAGAKNEARGVMLFEAINAHEDEELAEEVLRTWLLTKRPLLAAALDHLGIPHDKGLTESDDVARIEKLPPAELKALYEKLCTEAPADEVALYLRFMGATIEPGWQKAISA